MLAYCARHELSTGHLIYAAGNEVPARYVIEQAGVEIYCHSIALDRTPEDIARQVDEIVASSFAASRASRPHEP
jgi:5-methylcytosine-specific restriction enzyme subunit McrC